MVSGSPWQTLAWGSIPLVSASLPMWPSFLRVCPCLSLCRPTVMTFDVYILTLVCATVTLLTHKLTSTAAGGSDVNEYLRRHNSGHCTPFLAMGSCHFIRSQDLGHQLSPRLEGWACDPGPAIPLAAATSRCGHFCPHQETRHKAEILLGSPQRTLLLLD